MRLSDKELMALALRDTDFGGGFKDNMKSKMHKALPFLPGIFTGVAAYNVSKDVKGMSKSLDETNELLREFLLSKGGTPRGVITMDGITTGNPVGEFGDIKKDILG